MTVDEFISATKSAALAVQNKYGLPALAVMAQSALETGWGKHAPGNMYFGIKAGSSWTGKTQVLLTTEYVNGKYVKVNQTFRAYDNAEESFLDYGKLISSNSRYKNALQYTNDPEQYIREIAKAGYATDPGYAAKIISLIETIKKKLVL
jgi:flagellar protein FlgJ